MQGLRHGAPEVAHVVGVDGVERRSTRLGFEMTVIVKNRRPTQKEVQKLE